MAGGVQAVLPHVLRSFTTSSRRRATLVEGDRVAALCHVTGRHVGDALGGKATGHSIDFWGTTIGRVENGKIVDGWNTFDFLTMYQQIGWVESPVVGE